MENFVEMADFVQEWAVPVTVTFPGTRNTYDDDGKLVKGADLEPEPRMAVVLPFSNNELQKADNGNYTTYDRKVYSTEPLGMAVKVAYNSEVYEIDRELPQNAYTDVYRYYAKGKGPGTV